jgi:hypothetical protein
MCAPVPSHSSLALQTGRAKKVKSALLRVIQDTLGQLPAMLGSGQARANSSNALQELAGDRVQQQGSNRDQEMFMMTAAMGTLAATDFHSNDAGGMATAVADTAAGVGGDGVFLA